MFASFSFLWGAVVHRVIELLAYFIGYRFYLYQRRKNGDQISSANRLWIVSFALLGAVLGSKSPVLFEDAANMTSGVIFTSKTIVGALLGGCLFVEVIKYILGEKNPSGDLFCFPLIFGMIIGRIGCFVGGVHDQTFGIESKAFGIDFGDGVSRHPTQLYEIGFLLICYWVLRYQTLKPGKLFQYFLLSYFIFRFIIDQWKPLYIHPEIGLTSTQVLAVLGIVYCIYRLFCISWYKR